MLLNLSCFSFGFTESFHFRPHQIRSTLDLLRVGLLAVVLSRPLIIGLFIDFCLVSPLGFGCLGPDVSRKTLTPDANVTKLSSAQLSVTSQ